MIQKGGECFKMEHVRLSKRQAQSKKLIEDAFCYLLEEISFDEINISRICKQATVSRSTFYRFFADKKAVLTAVLAQKTRETTAIYEEILANCENGEGQALQLAYESFFNYWYGYRDLLKLLAADDLYQLFYEVYTANYGNTTTDRVIIDHLALDAFDHYYLGWVAAGLITVLRIWQKRHFAETPKQITAIMMQIRKSQTQYL